MLARGDIAAVAEVVIVHTHVATFVLSVRITLLGAGVPIVSTGVATLHPTIFIRTVAITDNLIVDICGVGRTVLRTLIVTCLCFWYWLASAAHWVSSITIAVNVIICAGVPWVEAAVVWAVLAQGDVAAAAGRPLPCA